MSKLNKLIKELCPNGVEYRKLEEVCLKITSGGTPSTQNSSYYGGDIPWLRTQEVDFCDIIDTSVKITEKGLNNSSAKWIPANCVIVAMYGATVGRTGINKIPLTTNQACCNLQINSEMALYKYVYYCLANKYEYIKSLGQGSQTNINSQIVKNLSIPLPPLPIQEEIVKILDRFAEYTAELQAELQARKEQYEYYRNLLLTNNFAYGSADDKQKITDNAHEEWKWMTLGEVGTFTYGYTDKAKNSGDTRFIRITDITEDGYLNPEGAMFIDSSEENKKFLLKKGDLLMARTGATYGKTLYVPNDTPSVYASFLIKISLDDSIILNRYYWHFSKSSLYWGQANKLASKGGQPQFNANALSLVKVLIPPLAEQQRIVSILDKFEALVSDLTQGLPAEIAASQERYEYYRDKLLRFERCN